MDFIIAKIGDRYGYLSTGKDGSYDFDDSYGRLLSDLEQKDPNYTYAKQGEEPLNKHQRKWTKRDNIYKNKLHYLKSDFDAAYAMVLMPYINEGR